MQIRFTMGRRFSRPGTLLALLLSLLTPTLWALDSYIIFGAGPVNQSMGGAGTAAPQSSLGAIMWNPAAATTLEPVPLFDAAVEIVGAKAKTSSSVPVAPGVVSSGTVESDLDVFPPLPFFGYSAPMDDGKTTLLLGAIPMFGFGVDYPAETGTPPNANVLLAPAPVGLGNVESFHALERFSLGVSRQVNDKLSLGANAIAAISVFELSSALFTSPNDANGDGVVSYPEAEREYAWGGGFQVGAHYQANNRLSLGLSFQSPIWLEAFEYNGKDELGGDVPFEIDIDAPAIASAGAGYQLDDNTLLALDVRYIPFSETAGFDESGFDETGALRGLGWNDIWTFKIGLQHELNESSTLRYGYSYAENAVPTSQVFFGIPAPVIAEHHIATGYSKDVSERTSVHLTGWYAFENSQTGPVYGPTGAPVPGAEVTNSVEAYSVSLGFTFKL